MKNDSSNSGAAIEGDPRWAAVLVRNPEADGKFFYSVSTTGVYCRPSCPSRAKNPRHVAFHPTAADAERAGFRPCKRCRPDLPSPAKRRADLVAGLCRYIEAAPEPPTLAELARRARLSEFHLHRIFKEIAGVTPKAYAAAIRAGRVRRELRSGASVTAAIYGAGFNSSGRFYEQSGRTLGMTPGRYRAGGAGTEIRYSIGSCSLGSILAARTDRGVCALFLGDDPDRLAIELRERFPQARLIPGDAGLDETTARAIGLIDDPRLGADLPLDIRGTAFHLRVWEALRRIPAGKTATYTDVAKRIGSPRSVRAVASACAANPIAVVIPCHRIVRRDGGLTGYRWGIERKRALLEREAPERTGGSDASVAGRKGRSR